MNKKLIDLLSSSTPDLAKWLKKWTDINGQDYYLKMPPGAKKSDKRVVLVAHIDKARTNDKIDVLFDKKYQTYWSPQGLGADDRAGIYAILQLYSRLPAKFKPYLLFCDKEEKGGIGAKEAAEDLKYLAKRISFMIELDRKGTKDAVFYNDESKKFKKYIEKFGFKSCYGTYSDISTIGKAWRIAGVNLSVGYFDQHTFYERLEYDILKETIKDTELLIRDAAINKKVWNLPKQKELSYNRFSSHASYCVCFQCREDKVKTLAAKNKQKELLYDTDSNEWVYEHGNGQITKYNSNKDTHYNRINNINKFILWFYCKICNAEYIEDREYATPTTNSWCPKCMNLSAYAGREIDH